MAATPKGSGSGALKATPASEASAPTEHPPSRSVTIVSAPTEHPPSRSVTITANVPFEHLQEHASALARLGTPAQVTVQGGASAIVSAVGEIQKHMDIASASISLRNPASTQAAEVAGPREQPPSRSVAVTREAPPSRSSSLRGDTPVE